MPIVRAHFIEPMLLSHLKASLLTGSRASRTLQDYQEQADIKLPVSF
jgi:hypothetical protein